MVAFALARYRFWGRELVYVVFTLGLLFPIAVAILPLYILSASSGCSTRRSAWRCRRPPSGSR